MAGLTQEGIGNALVIIDPQVDFHEGGSLGINGATDDSTRIAAFIRKNIDKIDNIFVTLDTHHRLHIAHAVCWTNPMGDSPDPFTLIKHEDIEKGNWVPRDSSLLEYAKYYTKALEKKGRFVLCIWPEHCLIGTPGHAVVPVLTEAINEWISKRMRTVNYVMKGTNCMTEMYSALAAEVPIPDDPSTSMDPALVRRLNKFEKVFICGEAKSHCVNYTMRDIESVWEHPRDRLVLLDDCTTAVAGFEASGEEFVKDMLEKGCTVTKAEEVTL